MSKSGKYTQTWGKTQMTYTAVAIIAAVIGLIVYIIVLGNNSDDVDYSDAPQIKTESEMAQMKTYTGKILIEGTMKGTEFSFDEKYSKVPMANRPKVDGKFLYTELKLTHSERYVKNEKDVQLNNAYPEYDYRDVSSIYKKQSDDLNVLGLPLDTEKLLLVNRIDKGQLYDAKDEDAYLHVIEGPEAPIVILGDMENGLLKNGTLYVNGTIEQAISDAKGGLWLYHIILIVWLVLCGIVVWSMYVQRYDEM